MLRMLLLLLCVLAGCASKQGDAQAPENRCSDGPSDDVKRAARTAGAGVETGVKTGVEGVKTFGRATGGLFRGGSDEARKEWKAGAAETDQVATEGASKTRKQANTQECP